MKKKKKFIVIVSHPIQYHAVLWRSMAKMDEIDFEVWFCSNHGQRRSLDKDFGVEFKWDVPLTDGYEHRFFKNIGFGSGFFKYININLIGSLLFKNIDYVYFHGVNNFTAYTSYWLAKLKAAKTIIRVIAHLLDGNSYNGFKAKLKNFIYGSVFRKSSVCLYIGKHNRSFFKHFGVQDEKLIHAPHIVDNAFFQKSRLNYEDKKVFKQKIGIHEEDLVLLFCGKLIPKKQPKLLLESYLNSNINKRVILLFVGDGILRNDLETLSNEKSKNDNIKTIKFLGFQNQTQLPSIYSISDVMVLPSFHQETWGLVVNEALNFNNAIIMSDNVGCGPELVEGKTGFIFNRNSFNELQDAIEKLINDEKLLKEYQSNSQKVINKWSQKEFIDAIKKIVNE